ncbi:methyltransferase domain-containing protein [Candidatus Dojkabacteria bacterium]|nr:methyltransferase domain-containing protein [Candidatus Dojkabacteria bacterium]
MSSQDITYYDKYDYDYSQFWKDRDYENFSETNVLKKILKNSTGNWILDVGGSYGRLTDLYYQKFHNCVLCDYSEKALEQAREDFKKRGIKNVNLVAANVYNLPFKTATFDSALMVRVIHHLEDWDTAISEVSRILSSKALFVLEFANKHNIKAILRAILKFNFKYIFSGEPSKIETSKSPEGTEATVPGIIYNYSPRHIRNLLVSHEINIKRSYCLSFLRIPFIKKFVPSVLLKVVEKFFQVVLGWTKITPSIIYQSYKKNGLSQQHFSDVEDLLCCPKCKGELDRKPSSLLCSKCNISFNIKNKVYDLRYPAPE